MPYSNQMCLKNIFSYKVSFESITVKCNFSKTYVSKCLLTLVKTQIQPYTEIRKGILIKTLLAARQAVVFAGAFADFWEGSAIPSELILSSDIRINYSLLISQRFPFILIFAHSILFTLIFMLLFSPGSFSTTASLLLSSKVKFIVNSLFLQYFHHIVD